MNIYHCFIDLREESKALAFAGDIGAWLGALQEKGAIEGWRLTRRKLNLASSKLGDFHLMIEVKDLAQLDHAFDVASEEESDIVQKYLNPLRTMIERSSFALYRDFPDPERVEVAALI